ncbi:fimbrial protein [Burkholderia ubonensis]|uniref:Fimbrial protein n=1 Tax=Burkholderia ubonensis TaxID=101571 RepID=A0A1R1JCV5_9BURK|nr:fimbrial protein [Burkholderia ubonensis]OMG72841.1 fimbrial protein [Burkholderia ubonensis]
MKISANSKLISLLIASAGLVAASAAQASDGTITITGNVMASTCQVDNGGNVAVSLPQVGANTLQSPGATAGRTPFTLSLKGCTAGTGNPTKVSAVFESGSNVDQTTGRLTLDTGTEEKPAAQNIQINVLNDQQKPIHVGAMGEQGSQVVDIAADGSAKLTYYAEYYATGKAEAGSANSKVQYSLTYQ